VIRSKARRQVAVFVGLTYAMTMLLAVAFPHSVAAPLLSVFTPVLSVAAITFLGTPAGLRRGLWAGFGFGSAGIRSWPVAIIFPIMFLTVAYGAAVVVGVTDLRGPDLSAHGLALTLPDLAITLTLGTVLILGEEIGWRGFLLPRLQVLTSRRRAAVGTGFLHGAFHLPVLLLTTTYDEVGNRFIVAPVVVATITAAGVFYAWLRGRSGSIWPVAIAHNTANTVFDLGAAAAVTSSPVALAYVAGETGIATLMVVAGVAIWLLSRSSVWDIESPPAGPSGSYGGKGVWQDEPLQVAPR
jgi:membrane protease YdiL (CAAX protease family)